MNADLQIESLSERRRIEDNKQFGRLTEKTQVLVPQLGLEEVTKNRATHSYEVATSSLMIAASIARQHGMTLFDIDYQISLYNISLLHDIGHPAFGHFSATLLNDTFVKLGVPEGFSDNNNNLTVIEVHDIAPRNYTLASTIKYPHDLYDEQKPTYLPMLEVAIKQDIEHFAKLGLKLTHLDRTIACQIMDEADRNSYTFADMTDFLCIGNKLVDEQVRQLAKDANFSDALMDRTEAFIKVAQTGSKSQIKALLSETKEEVNQNYRLGEFGIVYINPELVIFREMINKLTKIFYIRPLREMPFHIMNMKKLSFVLDHILSGKFAPSEYYREKIKNATNEIDKLRAMRDMIAETSDWYILKQYDRLLQDDITSRN